jgi:hypothetical protein
MERIEEFTREGKNFMFIDLSGITTREEFIEMSDAVMAAIAKYPENSLYTITNIKGIRFDSESKKRMETYMTHNKPYVKHGAVLGMNGVLKTMGNTMFKLIGRTNLRFMYSREQAVEWLLGLE